jgi:hypothetical protein
MLVGIHGGKVALRGGGVAVPDHGGAREGAHRVHEREANTVLKKMEGEQQRKSSGHGEPSSAVMAPRQRGNARLGLTFASTTVRAGARGSGARATRDLAQVEQRWCSAAVASLLLHCEREEKEANGEEERGSGGLKADV